MNTAQDVVRATAAEPAQIPISLGVVISIDGATARVRRDDGLVVTLSPDPSGRLPSLGKAVWMAANGADALVLGGDTLVAGEFKSPNWDGPEGSVGWGMDSNGNLYAASGIFRGVVEGAVFRTAATGPRVVIDSDAASRDVSFPTGDDDEVTVGAIRSYDDDDVIALELVSPTVDDDDEPGRVLITVDRATGETALDFVGDEIRSNGVSISRPPYSAKKRETGQAVTSSSSGFQAILWDTNIRVNGGSAITFNGATGTWTIARAGIYRVSLIGGWDDESIDTGSREVRIYEDGSGRLFDSKNAVVGRRCAHNGDDWIYVDVDGDGDVVPVTVQFRASQHNTGATTLNFTGRASISRYSD